MKPLTASRGDGGGGEASVDTSSTWGGGSTAASPYWRPPPSATAAHTDDAKGFSPFIAFCFTINYILGTGFLTLPWAFVQGGLVLSTLTLVGIGIISDLSKDYILETLARAEAMLDTRLHWKDPQFPNASPFLPKILRQAREEDALLLVRPAQPTLPPLQNIQYQTMEAQNISKSSSLVSLITPASSLPGTPRISQHGAPTHAAHNNHLYKNLYQIRERKFEINALCRVFLGKPALTMYTAIICLYCYCTLWAFACVFCSAMSKALPIIWTEANAPPEKDDDINYVLYAIIFALAVIPLSCLELSEQIVVQVSMTVCRFIMLYLMLTTCDDVVVGGQDETPPPAAPLVSWSGIPYMVPICVFAHIFHHSIPGLAHPVRNKKQLGSIFRFTVIFCIVAYSGLGWRLGTVFGMGTEQSVNINWSNYRPLHSSHWWTRAISMYVVCFPALDVLSAFPLNAITLGNNLLGAAYGKEVHTAEQNRWIRIQFRLLASGPPIGLAVLVRELGTITDYAGTTGFLLGFSFPALLYIASRKMAHRKQFAVVTQYTSYGSNTVASWFVFVFGPIMVVYVVLHLVKGSMDVEK